MTFPPNQGPQAPERNPPIEPGFYQPSVFVITALTLGQTTTVTTAVNHNYVVGQLVRLNVPLFFGTFQMNTITGYVLSIPAANQVVVGIDSTKMNAFIPNPPYSTTPPQILAVGDINSGQIISTGRSQTMQETTIPGAFINVSPSPVGTFV